MQSCYNGRTHHTRTHDNDMQLYRSAPSLSLCLFVSLSLSLSSVSIGFPLKFSVRPCAVFIDCCCSTLLCAFCLVSFSLFLYAACTSLASFWLMSFITQPVLSHTLRCLLSRPFCLISLIVFSLYLFSLSPLSPLSPSSLLLSYPLSRDSSWLFSISRLNVISLPALPQPPSIAWSSSGRRLCSTLTHTYTGTAGMGVLLLHGKSDHGSQTTAHRQRHSLYHHLWCRVLQMKCSFSMVAFSFSLFSLCVFFIVSSLCVSCPSCTYILSLVLTRLPFSSFS